MCWDKDEKNPMFCGVPREGAHAIRLLDFAVVDVASIMVAAMFFTAGTDWQRWLSGAAWTSSPYLIRLGWLLAAGVVAHRALGIRTKLDILLFPSA